MSSTAPETPPLYLTTREVADLIRVKERKVYDLAGADEIPHRRVTGKLLFPRKEILDWIDGDKKTVSRDRPPMTRCSTGQSGSLIADLPRSLTALQKALSGFRTVAPRSPGFISRPAQTGIFRSLKRDACRTACLFPLPSASAV